MPRLPIGVRTRLTTGSWLASSAGNRLLTLSHWLIAAERRKFHATCKPHGLTFIEAMATVRDMIIGSRRQATVKLSVVGSSV